VEARRFVPKLCSEISWVLLFRKPIVYQNVYNS
jgi:hypothetical protein